MQGRTQVVDKVGDAPTTNDHDGTRCKANLATAFHGERVFGSRRRNKHTHQTTDAYKWSNKVTQTHRQQNHCCTEQSQQSVLNGIGIENKHFLKKQTFSQSEPVRQNVVPPVHYQKHKNKELRLLHRSPLLWEIYTKIEDSNLICQLVCFSVSS